MKNHNVVRMKLIWRNLAESGKIWQKAILKRESIMADIRDMAYLPEGKTLEFKRDLSSSKPILKTLVAFANTAGGTLLIGKDNDGTIVGVDDVFAAEEKLANMIADSIHPPLMPEIEITSLYSYSCSSTL